MADIDDLLGELDEDEPASEIAAGTELEVVRDDGPVAEPPVIDVRANVERALSIQEEILASWRSDRCEAQDAANFIKRDVIDPIVQAGDRPSAGLIEQYVKALEVKAATNQTAVKCMDGIAKLLAATKQGGPSVQNNTLIAGNNKDLIAALKRPVLTSDP